MANPREGGRLEDMAVKGTSIPADAGTQRTIPSVPNPRQAAPASSAGADLASGADSARDIARSAADQGATGEVVTGTGDSLPATIETKNLGMQAGDMDNAKGHARYEKHIRAKGAVEDVLAGAGADVQPAPGEEELSQDTLRDRREA